MIPKLQVIGMYDYLMMVHQTTRRVIAAVPEDKLDWAPKPKMRTARDLIEHIYGQGLAKAEGAERGSMSLEELMAHHDSPRPGGTEDLLAWCDAKFAATQEKIRALPDEAFDKTVRAFFGEFPTGVFLGITYDEWWHHRGQLTVYLRLLDVAVPDIYGYQGIGNGE